jgi:hypothetical protein
MDFGEQMRHFRANLYHGLGHSAAVLDIANKADLILVDLSNKIRAGVVPVPRAWRGRFALEFDFDHAAIWRQVRQPILAIYGELDRQVPVAASSAALRAAVAKSGNRDFTLLVYPRASHAIGQTRTGELGEDWIGYDPIYLQDMTHWVLTHVSGATTPRQPMQRGQPSAAAQRFVAGRYDRLRWYGNATVQASLFVVFAVTFLAVAVAGLVSILRRGRGARAANVALASRWLSRLAIALSALNVVVLAGLVFLAHGLANNAWRPSYPAVLGHLPLAGSFSAFLTLVWLLLLVWSVRALPGSRLSKAGSMLFAASAMAFVPYMHYWNLLGLDLR